MKEKDINIEEEEVKTDETAVEEPSADVADSKETEEERDPLIVANEQIAELKDKYLRQVAEFRKLEDRLLPDGIDYLSIHGVRTEARQKLDQIRPRSIGQASRISGVSPADIAALMIWLGRRD